jgi:hypothetical protein
MKIKIKQTDEGFLVKHDANNGHETEYINDWHFFKTLEELEDFVTDRLNYAYDECICEDEDGECESYNCDNRGSKK